MNTYIIVLNTFQINSNFIAKFNIKLTYFNLLYYNLLFKFIFNVIQFYFDNLTIHLKVINFKYSFNIM